MKKVAYMVKETASLPGAAGQKGWIQWKMDLQWKNKPDTVQRLARQKA